MATISSTCALCTLSSRVGKQCPALSSQQVYLKMRSNTAAPGLCLKATKVRTVLVCSSGDGINGGNGPKTGGDGGGGGGRGYGEGGEEERPGGNKVVVPMLGSPDMVRSLVDLVTAIESRVLLACVGGPLAKNAAEYQKCKEKILNELEIAIADLMRFQANSMMKPVQIGETHPGNSHGEEF